MENIPDRFRRSRVMTILVIRDQHRRNWPNMNLKEPLSCDTSNCYDFCNNGQEILHSKLHFIWCSLLSFAMESRKMQHLFISWENPCLNFPRIDIGQKKSCDLCTTLDTIHKQIKIMPNVGRSKFNFLARKNVLFFYLIHWIKI